MLWMKYSDFGVDLMGRYKIHRKGKPSLIIKYITMIDTLMEWFEIMKWNDRKAMTTANLVETLLLDRHPWTNEIAMNQG